jgi:hypothetical protein
MLIFAAWILSLALETWPLKAPSYRNAGLILSATYGPICLANSYLSEKYSLIPFILFSGFVISQVVVTKIQAWDSA